MDVTIDTSQIVPQPGGITHIQSYTLYYMYMYLTLTKNVWVLRLKPYKHYFLNITRPATLKGQYHHDQQGMELEC